MLHVSPRSGQARRTQRLGVLAASLALACTVPVLAHAESAPPTLAEAAALSRAGDHLIAAARYEQLARRGFMSWDTGTALLAAREYAIGGALDDARRLAEKVRNRARSDAERTLLLEVDARIALDRGDPARALIALRALPTPLPQDSAADLLALRGRAEIASGDALSGVRTFEERGAALRSATDLAENDRLLFEQLRLNPPGLVTQGGVSERERGWLELPAVVAATGDAVGAAQGSTVQQWLASHPGHPGIAFIPGAASAGSSQTFTVGKGNAGQIALLLPLSGKQQAAGTAVRDGFTAAWFATSSSGDARPRIELYDTAADGAAAAYQRAIASGAQVIVGPLTKEDIAAVLAAQPAGLPVPTLALNAVTAPGMTAPAFLFQFALDPEQEARAVARRIAADGMARGVALFPDSAWGQRLQVAFTQELQAMGTVTLLSAQFYAPGTKDFSGPLRAALGRYGGAGDRSANSNQPSSAVRDAAAEQASGPQFAFVAATPQAARAIRPQLRFQMTYDLPLYTTSDAWDPSVRAAADMDGTVFPEMPWLLYGGQGAPELWDAVQEEWSARARGRLRLYAFGYDAYRLAQQFGGGSSAFVASVDGLTGLLELNGTDGRVQRSLQFARIEGGKPQAAGVGVIMNPATLPANATGTPPSN
jgi:outer membrane PBP1 activator LpoA protein